MLIIEVYSTSVTSSQISGLSAVSWAEFELRSNMTNGLAFDHPHLGSRQDT